MSHSNSSTHNNVQSHSNGETVPSIKLKAPVATDIGGSFTKVVYLSPLNPPALPSYVYKESFTRTLPQIDLDRSLSFSNASLGGVIKFLKFPTSQVPRFIDYVQTTNFHHMWGKGKIQTVNATGGGAYKYADTVKEKLNMTLQPHDEMDSLIRGLNFLLLNRADEVFTYSDQTKHFVSNPEESWYPYLLLSVGSGVSVLKIDSPTSYSRISGSAIGGGTFWGLVKLLTNVQSWTAAQELLAKGDQKKVDLLVGDIYGGDYTRFGLNASLNASSFGKVACNPEELNTYQPQDIIHSLMSMISQNISQIAYLNARLHGVKRVFCTGGFVQENPIFWERLSHAFDFWSNREMKAMFIVHDGYLAALGSLLSGSEEMKTER
jgi:pantothenate kinase